MTADHGNLAEMGLERDPYAPTPPPGQDQLPSEDGVPMESNRHRVQLGLLVETLADHWAHRDDVFVGGNMFVYFSELQTKGMDFRGPDVFVALDTQRKRSRKSWVVWEEGGKLPDVVIELLSDSTRHLDRGEKMRIYERIWKLGAYVLYDPFTHELEGYSLDAAGRFAPIVRDERGDLPITRLGLSLGLRPGGMREEPGPFLRWIDDGAVLATGGERAEAQRERAETAERRIAELEAELRRG